MKVGIFSPVINHCGGAEWVALSIIDTLNQYGHDTILLTNQSLNSKKIETIFNKKISVNKQYVIPFEFFKPGDYHNIYTDFLRSIFLKQKCDILIDTYTNAILPGVDISYIHYPLLRLVRESLPYFRNYLFFSPYRSYLNLEKKSKNGLVLCNSKYSAKAILEEYNIDAKVLYPPVSNDFYHNFEKNHNLQKENIVLTIARISKEKNLNFIPYIANQTHAETKFVIVGLLDSPLILKSLNKLIDKLNLVKRVKIFTNLKKEEMRTLLLKSKIYLHTKVGEHFGISIVEAMASGCIPIVHNSGGPREFLPQSQRFNTIKEAAKKIDTAFNDWTFNKVIEYSKRSEVFSAKSFSKNFMDIFNFHINTKQFRIKN